MNCRCGPILHLPRVHTFSLCFCSGHCGQGKAPAPWHFLMSLMKAEASHGLVLGVHLLLSFWCHPAKSPSLCGDNERRHMEQSWVTSEAPADSQPTCTPVSECSRGWPRCPANHQQTKDTWTINSMLCVSEVWGLLLMQHYCGNRLLTHLKLIGV